MTVITGPRTTGNIDQARRAIDMKQDILLLEPNSAPLTVLANRLNSEATTNPEYSWNQDELEPRFDAVNGTTGTGTSIVVDNGTYFQINDLVKVTRTGELVRVTVISTNTLTVTRGLGASAVAVADNDELLILGGSQPEGDTSRIARSQNPTNVKNYTQITRDSWESTETLRHSNTFTRPSDWNYMARKKGIEHKKSLEYIYWHGRPSENLTGGANGNPIRTSGGVFHYVTTNQTDAGGQLTEAEFWAALNPAFRYGPKTKTAFASRLAVDVVNGFPRGKLEAVQADQDTTYGLNVMKFRSPHGELNFVCHDLLEGAKFGGYIAILDLAQIRARPLANAEVGSRDTHIKENIQANDADSRKDEYITEGGLEFGQEKTHALITGITS